jgi:hypothetical protein
MGIMHTAQWGRLVTAAVLAAAAFGAHARDASDEAMGGAVADGVTTAVGIAAGAAELNPLGPVLSVGVKVALFQYAKGLPDTEQPGVYAAAASWWQGAAVNNTCIAAAVLSGGSFAPACVALGVAWGMKTWKDTEPEREFWQGCAMLRQYAQQPQMPCVYTPPKMQQAAASAVPAMSEDEREFWQGCAMLRQYAQQPQMPCVYTPPGMQPAVAPAAPVMSVELRSSL